jgi:putative Mn2+ efflux pump MntP
MIHLLCWLCPLGLDTLGLALSLGLQHASPKRGTSWHLLLILLPTALLFAGAEMLMPLLGLALGYALAQNFSILARLACPFLLIVLGLWELFHEWHESATPQTQQPCTLASPGGASPLALAGWLKYGLLALALSIDELLVGFSLGSVATLSLGGKPLSLLMLCLSIGLQGCLMTILGLSIGQLASSFTPRLTQWSAWLAGCYLLGLGIWMLFFGH